MSLPLLLGHAALTVEEWEEISYSRSRESLDVPPAAGT
jgi:hypothetical protein